MALFFELSLCFQQLKWVEVKGTIQHSEETKISLSKCHEKEPTCFFFFFGIADMFVK